ncbi:hypothetical protein COS77_02615 [Candidatus Roizmanbacteria bacterium CG06_land_8_20_14_3_00_34_14]|uniref:Polymerase beta nucleotidyltransferase domain-containing protein n=2 Tax=Candidatus Roizmaniibacteriota TaxID=1752723 RepID=A0A2M7AUC1_9BACT|nr:MAG: hypothetical protein COT02_02985 [Candidatus Roizmanbacteria bacterium CG07_land_8_20_14_0_80_34_15]PIU74231.1 MAG: hypothetical protein COS77_02615 [Candidatus Roizmanbacteria bacterium CG06_land_8_20_14_3_00_34_14]
MLDFKISQLLGRIVYKYLPKDSYNAFVFGSRATGKNRKFSDLDLGIKGPKPLTPKEYILIKNDLDDSDIPYRVDLVDFAKVNNKFKQILNSSIIKI